MQIIAAMRSIALFIIDTVVPPDEAVRELERMGPQGLEARACEDDGSKAGHGAQSFFRYRVDAPIRAALIELKTRRNMRTANALGGWIGERLLADAAEEALFSGLSSPLLVPVPVTKRRLRERGWNQSELIIQGIVRGDAGSVFEVSTKALEKIRESGDQVGRGRSQRIESLAGCFRADPMIVRGRRVFVVDDIVTTGATLREARRALAEADAPDRGIRLASIAR